MLKFDILKASAFLLVLLALRESVARPLDGLGSESNTESRKRA